MPKPEFVDDFEEFEFAVQIIHNATHCTCISLFEFEFVYISCCHIHNVSIEIIFVTHFTYWTTQAKSNGNHPDN